MNQPNDIEIAKMKSLLRKLSEAVDGVEHPLALTVIETFAATALAMVGGDPVLVDGFCDGIKRAVPRLRASINEKEVKWS